MTRLFRSLAFVMLAFLASVTPASAAFITYDLTGTWTGSITCNTLIGGVKQKDVFATTMKVSQLGLHFGFEIAFNGVPFTYAGLANPDVKKPEQKGEAAVIRCGTNDDLTFAVIDDIGRMIVTTKPNKVKASFKGTSLFINPNDAPANHGTCKWKFTRTNGADPGVSTACGGPNVRVPPARAAFGGGVR